MKIISVDHKAVSSSKLTNPRRATATVPTQTPEKSSPSADLDNPNWLQFEFVKSERASMPPPAPYLLEKIFSEIEGRCEKANRLANNASKVVEVDFRKSIRAAPTAKACVILSFGSLARSRFDLKTSPTVTKPPQLLLVDEKEKLRM
jgi:hypothetical protein